MATIWDSCDRIQDQWRTCIYWEEVFNYPSWLEDIINGITPEHFKQKYQWFWLREDIPFPMFYYWLGSCKLILWRDSIFLYYDKTGGYKDPEDLINGAYLTESEFLAVWWRVERISKKDRNTQVCVYDFFHARQFKPLHLVNTNWVMSEIQRRFSKIEKTA